MRLSNGLLLLNGSVSLKIKDEHKANVPLELRLGSHQNLHL